jgi:hypothetical protein
MCSVFDNTMNAVKNITIGMCLGGAVGLFWPISFPSTIFLYLKKDEDENEDEYIPLYSYKECERRPTRR